MCLSSLKLFPRLYGSDADLLERHNAAHTYIHKALQSIDEENECSVEETTSVLRDARGFLYHHTELRLARYRSSRQIVWSIYILRRLTNLMRSTSRDRISRKEKKSFFAILRRRSADGCPARRRRRLLHHRNPRYGTMSSRSARRPCRAAARRRSGTRCRSTASWSQRAFAEHNRAPCCSAARPSSLCACLGRLEETPSDSLLSSNSRRTCEHTEWGIDFF